MLALAALLSLASHGAAGVDLGCDNLCHLRGLWLSCRLHIHWSKNNEYNNDPTACHSAHEHVLSACLPHCFGCAVESLGAGCANEATTIVTDTTATTTTTAATTTPKADTTATKAATTTTQMATTTTKAATTTKTTTSKTTTARTTSKTATSETGTNTTTRVTTSSTTTLSTAVTATNRKGITRSTSTVAAAVEPITKMGDSANETAGSHTPGASALNASKTKQHPAVTASSASSVKHSPIETRNSSADAADAAIDKHNLSSTTRGTSENSSVNGTTGKSIKKIPGTNHSNEIQSHAKSSNKSNNRTAGHTAAGATAARNTSSNRTTPYVSKTKATTTKTITTETTTAPEIITENTTTTLLESFCCSAALDDANFCGTCWENAPLMNDKYCRASKDSCEDCGHVWCNRTDSKGSCKKYGCVEFQALNDCQCNPDCVDYGSCCDDYMETCAPSAPAGEVQDGTATEAAAVSEPADDSCAQLGCTNEYRPAFQCQCNDACEAHGSCCPDYWDQCAAFAEKHEVGVRFLTARMGVIAMVVPSALALTALLGWFAARRGWLTYSGQSLALRAMAEGGRPEETDAQVALMQPVPGEVGFMSSP